MKRVHKSQVREILLQLTDLQNKLNTVFWEAGEDMSVHEEITIKRTLDELKTAIGDLVGVI